MEKNKNIVPVGLPRLARQVNLQTVARQMRQMELFSRIELARHLGISTTTMTKLFAQLEEDELIVKSPVEDKSFGRPKILYQFSPALQIAAVVIDVEATTICFAGLQGTISEKHQVVFPTGNSPEKLFDRIHLEFTNLKNRLEASCRLIGVCIPGLVEIQSGQSMLNPNLHWLEGTRPKDILSRKLNLPAVIMHEERALGRAQLRSIDATSNYITMDFSSGVGMSVVSDGNHLSGGNGYAGEIGHIIMQPGGKLCGCGNRGCLETLAADRCFFSELELSMEDAVRRLSAKDSGALERIGQVIEWQATGIAAAINIFNPDRVFVYSRLSDAYPYYIEELRCGVEKRSLGFSFDNCRIRTTREGKLMGALLLTVDHLIEKATTP